MIDITEKDGSVIFTLRVVPRASRTEVAGTLGGALKVRVTAPPVEGAANAELVKLFAKTFRVPKGAVQIISGEASRVKQIRIDGITAEQLINAL